MSVNEETSPQAAAAQDAAVPAATVPAAAAQDAAVPAAAAQDAAVPAAAAQDAAVQDAVAILIKEPASAQQQSNLIFQGANAGVTDDCCGSIVRGLLLRLLVIGVCFVLPVVMIVYGVQNNAMICESPCVGSCGDIQRFHVLHTPPIGISVPQALIVSGVIYIVLGVVCFMCCYILITDKPTATKIINAATLLVIMSILALFIWGCFCLKIIQSMDSQCTNYNASTGDASIVSMERNLLLVPSVVIVILFCIGALPAFYKSFIQWICNARITMLLQRATHL